ncbi:hypothetical protein L208DRAFT_1284456 [Tricholoma matsutake]|nr:hypothetical protein L208DRAFT_1284456 [Tricholoma matsutake 945]
MTQCRTLTQIDDVKWRNCVEMVRKKIYEQGYVVDSTAVEDLLQEDSLVPTANAFSSKLAPFGFNMFGMLAVDLMHEVELSVWKAVFIHLLCILDCQNENLKHELDRWQASFEASEGLIPPFGVDGIRKIRSNWLELKKMTAHD